MQTLTRRLDSVSRISGVEGYKNGRIRDLVLLSSPEPLNCKVARNGNLSLPRNVEGHSTPKGGRLSPALRVPVVGVDGKPLMPTTPQRARKLLKDGIAEKQWNKLGQFYIQMLRQVGTEKQQICLAVDPGSKWDGVAVVSEKGVLTSGMLVLPSRVAEKLEQRKQMRQTIQPTHIQQTGATPIPPTNKWCGFPWGTLMNNKDKRVDAPQTGG